ncbi:MAG: hypothetical protein M3347_04980 [Armatimonadota bacterium]|nr:hypothetical protein [Armatimonadota bacterium]
MDETRVSHDQLFKELLRAFFREFMELFFPAVAARLDFSHVVLLDREVFTDVPEGALREPDLVARVNTQSGEPELILIHVEVQARRDRDFGARMLEYYMLLQLRYKLPVFPIVLYLERGAGGLGADRYEQSLFETPILTFTYQRIGAPDLAAEEYLQTANPLAYGLAALMRPGERHAAEIKANCLLQIARALIDEARKVLLANCVETYLRLDEGEQQLFERLVQQPDYEEVTEMQSVYEIKGEERGIAIGEVRGKRDAVLVLLRERFGDLPEPVEAHVHALQDESELDELLRAALRAPSLDALGLNGAIENGQQS